MFVNFLMILDCIEGIIAGGGELKINENWKIVKIESE